jgi:hypothetical protein
VLLQQHATENVRRLNDGGMGGVDIHFFNHRMLTRAQELWKKLPVWRNDQSICTENVQPEIHVNQGNMRRKD